VREGGAFASYTSRNWRVAPPAAQRRWRRLHHGALAAHYYKVQQHVKPSGMRKTLLAPQASIVYASAILYLSPLTVGHTYTRRTAYLAFIYAFRLYSPPTFWNGVEDHLPV